MPAETVNDSASGRVSIAKGDSSVSARFYFFLLLLVLLLGVCTSWWIAISLLPWLCVSASLRFHRQQTPALICDAEGVHDDTAQVAGGLVRWDEIRQIEVKEYTGQQLLLIHLHDPEQYLTRLPLWKQRRLRRNLPLFNTPCVVEQEDIALPVQEAQALLEATRQRFTAQPIAAGVPSTSTSSSGRWWTAIPPEERKTVSLRQSSDKDQNR